MTRRAMTLVEVLAATVLLSALAVAAVGFMRDAARVARSTDDPHRDVFELARVADGAMKSEALVRRLAVRDRFPAATLPVDGGPSVRLTRLDPASPDADHAWALFERHGCTVSRWVKLDPSRGGGRRRR